MSFFSGKGLGFIVAIDSLINAVFQSVFHSKDAA